MPRCRSSWRSSSAAWWPSSCTTTSFRASSRASTCSIGCAAGCESARGDDRMSDETPAQRFATRVIHGGQRPDPLTGAVMPPIYATSTYVQSSPGVHQGYDYSRTRNPTRDALQAALASLEGGAAGFAFASGMAAIATVLELLDAGSHIVAMHDLYGGSYRLLENVRKRSAGHRVSFVDLSDPTAFAGAIRPDTRLVWVERPTNPLLKLVDLSAGAPLARHGAQGDQRQQRVGRALRPHQSRVGTDGAGERRGVRQIDERDAVSGRALAHVLQQAVAAAVQIVHGDDVRAGIQQLEHRGDRGHAGGEGEAGRAPFQARQRRLQRVARRVARARVIVALVHAGTRLHVGGGRVDRRHDRPGERIRALAAVDDARREALRGSLVTHAIVTSGALTACGAAN